MKAFDLQRMALDKVPLEFLGEVALRSLYTFVLVFLFLKITGRRGVRQMSLFEVLIILTLGSAAGDVAFYDDVPMLPVLMVFITLALLYRLVMWLMSHSEKLEDLLEGRPVIFIEEGQLAWEKVNAANLTEFEFFMELRISSVEQLGQIKLAIMETNGQISVYYYPDDEVKPGLCILPEGIERYTTVPDNGDYACNKCSAVYAMKAGEHRLCPRCAHPEWSKASRAKRIT
ncbi:DUF421 domain-containing protein [Superficieibacter electus]|uniref:DUF421 domain-containing protein n=1 Tax=Superficieibacter electus TaxID=2022662 RepID=A0A2P5GRM1_9ENTR|nr:DUF421 domain-containing protein [Superficieibacter electus]POP45890.1 DUF421 domain-containing protein [Superficieibacter electus]POP49197.1 DUF421 domain-containing protein [Superficieibacter electus]